MSNSLAKRVFQSLAFIAGLSLHSACLAETQPRATTAQADLKAGPRADWKILIERIDATIKLDQMDAGIALTKDALQLAERHFGVDDESSLATVSYLIYFYTKQARYNESTPLLERLVSARERHSGKNDPETLKTISSLAYNLERLGRFPEAEPLRKRVFDAQVLALGRDHADTLGAEGYLANVYVKLGRYGAGEQLLTHVFETFERDRGNDHIYTLRAMELLASVLEDQGRNAEAESLFVRGLETSERLFGKEDSLTLTFVNDLGRLYHDLGKDAEGESLLLRALEARERLLGKDNPFTLQTLNSLSLLYGAQGRFAEAIPLAKRLVENSERRLGASHPDTLGLIYNLANHYEYSGRYVDADPLFARVLAEHERLLGAQHPHSLMLDYALTTNRLSDPTLAKSAIGPARALVAGKRARRISSDASAYAQAQIEREGKARPSDFIWFAEAAWYAEDEDTKRQDLYPEVFTALQDAISGMAGKAVGLAAVRQTAESKSAGLGLLTRQRQDLDKQWESNAALINRTISDDGPKSRSLRQSLANERQKLEVEMDRLDSRLRSEFPDYFALVRSESVTLAATQKLLGPDDAILLAVQSTMSTHVVAVSRTSVKWSRTHWDKDITARSVKRLLWDVGVDVGVDILTSEKWERESGGGYAYDRKTAYALYQQLIAPVASVLAGKRHVFITSGGVLSSFPFGILVTDAPVGKDGDPAALRATKWFADAHALITIPSVQSLQFLRRAAPKMPSSLNVATLDFVGYGDPILSGRAMNRGAKQGRGHAARTMFSSNLSRTGSGIANVAEIASLARLPGTASELENMRVALGAPSSAVHVQSQATEHAIRSADLSKVRILALATHGMMAGELAGAAEPGLVFTPPAIASDQDDGFLTASEVSEMRLDADLVVLSACNTAAGDGSEGAPGLSGLARAFFYAGARNLFVSHWPVRDDVAARITVDAIRRQKSDPVLSRAEALQQAMRAIRNDATHDLPDDSWSHPNAWAAFSLIGDGAH